MSCGDSTQNLRLNGVDDFNILDMANLIARPLQTGELRFRDGRQPSQAQRTGTDNGTLLVRIRGEDGSSTYPKKDGDRVQRARQRACFICRRYKVKTQNTQWMCRHCGMPLCSVCRGRDKSCADEHMHASDIHLGCGKLIRAANSFIMPDNLKIFRKTRADTQHKKRKHGAKAIAATLPPQSDARNK